MLRKPEVVSSEEREEWMEVPFPEGDKKMDQKEIYQDLRDRGVLTVDDLIKKLQALKEDERKMPILYYAEGWYHYITDVEVPEDGFPVMERAERGFDSRDF